MDEGPKLTRTRHIERRKKISSRTLKSIFFRFYRNRGRSFFLLKQINSFWFTTRMCFVIIKRQLFSYRPASATSSFTFYFHYTKRKERWMEWQMSKSLCIVSILEIFFCMAVPVQRIFIRRGNPNKNFKEIQLESLTFKAKMNFPD